MEIHAFFMQKAKGMLILIGNRLKMFGTLQGVPKNVSSSVWTFCFTKHSKDQEKIMKIKMIQKIKDNEDSQWRLRSLESLESSESSEL